LTLGHIDADGVDDQTEALTKRGWLTYDQVRPGDAIRALDPGTGRAAWRVVERVHVYRGTHIVRQLEARSHSSVTTLGHNWLTRDHYTKKLRARVTDRLTSTDRIIRAAPPSDLPTSPTYSDALVELLAWFWTEGHIRPDGAVQIYQSQRVNPAHCVKIRAAMLSHFGEPTPKLTTGRWRVPGWLERPPTDRKGVIEWYMNWPLGNTLTDLAPNRIVRPDVIAAMTASQLRLFIETSIDADGHRRVGDQLGTLAQKSLKQIESAEMACALLGVPTTRYRIFDSRFNRHAWTLRPGAVAEIRPVASAMRMDGRFIERQIQAIRATEVEAEIEGIVWCPELDGYSWLARRRGTVYYTGDSQGLGQMILPLASLSRAS
jgi:hypothetical protein